MLEGKLPREAVLRAKSAWKLVTRGDVEALLETASVEHLAESFKHLKCLAEALELRLKKER